MKPLLPDEIASEIRIPEEGCYCCVCEAARREKPQTVARRAGDKKRVAVFTQESNRRLNKRI